MTVSEAVERAAPHARLAARLRTAVVVPCHNEARTIAKVVGDFRAALPAAAVYVYDNASRDATRAEAERAGAIVRSEPRRGKGFVVRRMFADIEADIFVMADGDDTYDATVAGALVDQLLVQGLDMVNGARDDKTEGAAYRRGHKTGNALLTGCVQLIFGRGFRDMLSGYRVLSRRFVKSFPMTATGFEIETELTVHALDLEMPFAEIWTDYRERPAGSESKLRTLSDGWRILWTIAKLLKRERPMALFGAVSAASMLLALLLAAPIVATYVTTGLVPRFPTLIVATGIGVTSLLSLACGLILDTVTWGRREVKRLQYLAVPGAHASVERRDRAQEA